MNGKPNAEYPPSGHRSFVLRLWWDRSKENRVLRISIEDTETGEWQGFQNLGELLNFLFQVIYDP
jgi:hypothetical protein